LFLGQYGPLRRIPCKLRELCKHFRPLTVYPAVDLFHNMNHSLKHTLNPASDCLTYATIF
jgi:hypothetical protein